MPNSLYSPVTTSRRVGSLGTVVSGQATVPFNALTFGTPVLWVTPSSATYRSTTGTEVDSLTDRSASAIVVNQTTANLRPALVAGGFNGKDCIDFSNHATLAFLNLGTLPAVTATGGMWGIAAVLVPSGRVLNMEILGGDATATKLEWRIASDGTQHLISNLVVDIGNSTAGITDDVCAIVAFSYDKVTLKFWNDGVARGSIAATNDINGGPAFIGTTSGTATNIGKLAELALYSGVPIAQTVLAAMAAMKAYYGTP